MNERLELEVTVPLERVNLHGTLAVPKNSFEESGALEQVAQIARDWFGRHLGSAATNREAIVS